MRPIAVVVSDVEIQRLPQAFRCNAQGRQEGHPLATPVNRDERNSAVRPAFSLLHARPATALRTWFSSSGCAQPRTSHPSGSRPARCTLPAPGCHRSPRKPSVPHRVQFSRARCARTDLWFRRERPNPGWLAMRAQPRVARAGPVAACNQVCWLCQPQSGTAATAPLTVIRKLAPNRRARRFSSRASRPARACGPPPWWPPLATCGRSSSGRTA